MLRYFEENEIALEKSKRDRIWTRLYKVFFELKKYEETDFQECYMINGTPTYIMRVLQENEKIKADLCEEILRAALKEIRVVLWEDLGEKYLGKIWYDDLFSFSNGNGDYDREIRLAFKELIFCEYDGIYDSIFRDAILLDVYNYYRLVYNKNYHDEIIIQTNDGKNIKVINKEVGEGVCKYIEGLSESKAKLLLSGKKISSIYTGDCISFEKEDRKYLAKRFSSYFNEETQLRILLEKDVKNMLSAALPQGKTFLAVKDVYISLCCKKEKEIWQEESDIQKEEYMDCLLIERMTGFNLAMALYEGNLPLIEGNSKECEELISETIRNILKIHSPILRILVVDIVYGYVGQAFAMKIIKTGKAALEEINSYIRNYAGDVALEYELGKEAASEEIENYYSPSKEEIEDYDLPDSNELNENDEKLEPAFSFSKFSLLRKIEKGDSLREADLDEETKEELKEYKKYTGPNLLDDKIGKIVTRSKYRLFPQEIEKKIQESNILTELKNAKKDDYRYKFFAFIMKNIVSKNIIISEENK